MNQKTLFRISLSALVIILAIFTCRLDISRIQNPIWLVLLIASVLRSLIREARKSLNGKEIAWNQLTPKDKLIFPSYMSVLLVFVFLPIELGLSVGVILAILMIGFAFNWFTADKLGSDALRDLLLS